jgi:hypothetical protein
MKKASEAAIGLGMALVILATCLVLVATCAGAKSRAKALSPLARAELRTALADHESLLTQAKLAKEAIDRVTGVADSSVLVKVRQICDDAGIDFDAYVAGKVTIDARTGAIEDVPQPSPAPPKK